MNMNSYGDFPLGLRLALWAIMTFKTMEIALYSVQWILNYNFRCKLKGVVTYSTLNKCVTHSVDSCLCALAAEARAVSRGAPALASSAPY